jgi:hypothetical protein
LIMDTTTNLTVKDGSTALTGALPFANNGTFALDYDGEPWFITSAGNNFIINQSGIAQISGRVYYTQS